MQNMQVPIYKLFALSKVQSQILNGLVNSAVHFHFLSTSSQLEALQKKILDIKQQSLALAYSRISRFNNSPFEITEPKNFEGTLPPLKDLARPYLEMQKQNDIDFFLYLIIPAYTNYFSNSFFFDEFYDFIDQLFSTSDEQIDSSQENSNLKKILQCCSRVFNTFEMNFLFNSAWFSDFSNYYSSHLIDGGNHSEANRKDSKQGEQKNFLNLLLDSLKRKSSSIPEYVFKVVEKLNQKNLAFKFIKEYFLIPLFKDPSSFSVLRYYQDSLFVKYIFEPLQNSIEFEKPGFTELIDQFRIFFSQDGKINDLNRKTIYVYNRQNETPNFISIPEFNMRIFSEEEIRFIGLYTKRNYEIKPGFYIEQNITKEPQLARNASLPIPPGNPEKKALRNILKFSSPFSIPFAFPIKFSDYMDDIMSNNEENMPPELKTKVDLKKFILNQIQRSRKEKQPILFKSFKEIEKIFIYVDSHTGKQIMEDNQYSHDYDQMKADSLQSLSQTMDNFWSLIKSSCFNLNLYCFNVLHQIISKSPLKFILNSNQNDPQELLIVFRNFLGDSNLKNNESLKSFDQNLVMETVFHLIYRHISYKQFKASNPDLFVLDKYIQEIHGEQFFTNCDYMNLSPYADQITKFHDLMMAEDDPLQKYMDIHLFMNSIVKEKEKMLEAYDVLSKKLVPLINPPEIASCVNFIDKYLFPDGNIINEIGFKFPAKPSVPLQLLYTGLETFVLQPKVTLNVQIYGENLQIDMMKKIMNWQAASPTLVLASHDVSTQSYNRPIKFVINFSNKQFVNFQTSRSKDLEFFVTKFNDKIIKNDKKIMYIIVPNKIGDQVPDLSSYQWMCVCEPVSENPKRPNPFLDSLLDLGIQEIEKKK